MAARSDDLTGRWLGRYDYQGAAEPVPFEVDLHDAGGTLTGDITEPNSFRPDQGTILSAVLNGDHNGQRVSFLKRYVGFDQGDHPRYQGELNAARTRIEGRWHFPKSPTLTGRFVMMRKPRAAAEEKARGSAEVAETAVRSVR
ncbi:hypothetical protein OU426_12275 [Frigidibacter sp. RF13]|uniref:hypothetical protein n=1 Tax=Frigidibacter sp. RF13 TaxID=2997340 RepID=UPI00226E079E|nr:hypothetical protein [Frigidibacter sp. RF13]MCY1127634.1 hypothetical protein [Frigidibacter sp. RF13]